MSMTVILLTCLLNNSVWVYITIAWENFVGEDSATCSTFCISLGLNLNFGCARCSMFIGFCKHFILNELSYIQGFATLVSQLGYELSSSEVFCFLAKLWILYCVHLHFQGFKIQIFIKSKFLGAGGLAKLSVLTQLSGCGFVEDSRMFFFLCCFHLPLCNQDYSMVWLQCTPVGAQDFLFADIHFSHC